MYSGTTFVDSSSLQNKLDNHFWDFFYDTSKVIAIFMNVHQSAIRLPVREESIYRDVESSIQEICTFMINFNCYLQSFLFEHFYDIFPEFILLGTGHFGKNNLTIISIQTNRWTIHEKGLKFL